MEFRDELLAYAQRRRKGKFYQPLTHPDLQDIPCLHTESRWEMIERNLPVERGGVLDIGANVGYFSRKLTERGFDCVAVELRRHNASVMAALNPAEGLDCEIYNASIFDYPRRDFDLVLALNVFHHFFKTDALCKDLEQFLRALRMRFLFLETHHPDERQMRTAYRNFSPEEYVAFVLGHSQLTRSRHLGTTDTGRRQLFLLSRD